MSKRRQQSKKPSEREIQKKVREEVGRSHKTLIIIEVSNVLNTLIRWGTPSCAVVFASYFLGGQMTGLKIEGIFSAFANQWVYLCVAALCGGGWYIERGALRNRIKQISDEKRELEAIIDPSRSSSGMNAYGVPN